MNALLSPSMMCIPFDKTNEYIQIFEKHNIDYLHVDIMDGNFVPNYGLGVDYVKRLREVTSIPIDLHLMISNPDFKLSWFDVKPNEIVSIHAESTIHLQRVIQQIKEMGAKPFVAINPATPLCALDYILDDISGVLVMTVNPGFAGQKAVPSAIRKLKALREYLDGNGRNDALIEVDGNVSYSLAASMRANCADIFVLGTSSVLRKNIDTASEIEQLRQLIK